MTQKHAVITPSVLDSLSRELSMAKKALNDLDGIKAYVHINNAECTVWGLYGDLVETDKITEAVIKANLPKYVQEFNLKYGL